jgi:propionate CoA-transferase
VFCGFFVDKAKVEVGGGRVSVAEEGRVRKFVRDVGQITFAGKYVMPGQSVLYVTERCVFRLIDGVLTLIGVAPGIDLDRDVLGQMDFAPAIASDLRLMDEGIFHERWLF